MIIIEKTVHCVRSALTTLFMQKFQGLTTTSSVHKQYWLMGASLTSMIKDSVSFYKRKPPN